MIDFSIVALVLEHGSDVKMESMVTACIEKRRCFKSTL